MRRLIRLLLIVVMTMTGLSLQAQEVTKVGTTAAKFLSIPVGARALAMGGAYTALANDASAIYWNPGGLAQVTSREVFFMHSEWLADINFDHFALALGSDWAENLPNGLQTDVGERGTRLSLGQRQLVVLARVLAQNPAIFILDEATASVDPFTEAQIQDALDRLFKDRTSIVIAHRLSTVKAADLIIVLDQGRIIEAGSHEALMAEGGHYAELYDTYFRHQSLDYIGERGGARQ